MRVYIAGPYTKGDVAVNVRNAVLAADKLLEIGCDPYIPHLTHFWHLISPKEYQRWLTLDLVWLKQCECVLRLPGESNGADGEVNEAKKSRIPVYYSIEEVAAHAGSSA